MEGEFRYWAEAETTAVQRWWYASRSWPSDGFITKSQKVDIFGNPVEEDSDG